MAPTSGKESLQHKMVVAGYQSRWRGLWAGWTPLISVHRVRVYWLQAGYAGHGLGAAGRWWH